MTNNTLHGLRFIVIFLIASLNCFHLQATDYVVNKHGDDGNNGKTRQTAFATIQKGVDALSSGDTLTIGPGEYFETVKRDDLGCEELETVIQAETPGTVVLRGDAQAPKFKPVKGLDKVFVGEFDGDVQSVIERDSLTMFLPAVNRYELSYLPAMFYHDKKNNQLYISTSDYRSPADHFYTISVTNDHGLLLKNPTRVTIKGLAFTGYTSGVPLQKWGYQKTIWGMWLESPVKCLIRECVGFLNGGGIGMTSRPRNGQNVVEYCRVYGNYNPLYPVGAIGIFHPNYDIMRGNYSFESRGLAMQFYLYGGGTALMEHNIAMDGGFQIKFKPQAGSRIRNSVSLAASHSHNANNTIIGTYNLYVGQGSITKVDIKDCIQLSRVENLDQQAEFTDPLNADFRLQSTSRFRGAGENGEDLGPYPFKGDVFFVSEDGDDGADGMSISAAWKTLGHALKTIKPGQTVYLTAGIYRGGVTMNLRGTRGRKTYVRARGTDQVRIEGGLTIDDSSGLTFERLQFDGTVSIKNSEGVNFDNCVFNAGTPGLAGRSVDGLRVTLSLFTGTRDAGVSLSSCKGVVLSGDLFDNDSGVGIAADSLDAIEYSGYNGFSDGTSAWRRDGENLSLDSLAGDRELQSIARPIDAVAANGFIQVKNQQDFAARGPLAMWIGPHRHLRDRESVVTKPTVHSVSATTANIEWRSSYPGVFTVAWGESPDADQHTARAFVKNFGTYSVRGLKPDTTYSFRLVKARTSTSIADFNQARRFRLDAEPVTFKTLKTDPAPKTYYVSPDGDNQNSGDSLENAWKTVTHAAAQVRPGDTVRIAEGIYPERFRVRATGTRDAPITFTPVKGARVIFDSGGMLNGFCVVEYKDYIHLDGLRFMAVQINSRTCFFGNTAIRARDANYLHVTRCMLDGRGLAISGSLIKALDCKDLLMKNCVQIDDMGSGAHFLNCPNLRIENNVFLRSKIGCLCIENRPGDPAYLRNNIITDNLVIKLGGPTVSVGWHSSLDMDNNGFYVRDLEKSKIFYVYGRIAYERSLKAHEIIGWEDDPKHPITDDVAHRASLAEWEDKWHKSVSVKGDPGFAVYANDPEALKTARQYLTIKKKYKHNGILVDWLISGKKGEPIDFHDLFATNPEYVKKGIGLEPEAFAEFGE